VRETLRGRGEERERRGEREKGRKGEREKGEGSTGRLQKYPEGVKSE